MKKKKYDIVIIGGLGHVGLPLGIVFADSGFKVCLYDINQDSIGSVKKGKMPFIEYGAEDKLKATLKKGTLSVSSNPESIRDGSYIVIAIGTPIDAYLNPNIKKFMDFMESIRKYLSPDQTIIIRSTVYPHTCEQVKYLLGKGKWKVSYCPERIVQGYSVQELKELPQLVAGLSKEAEDSAAKLFGAISPKVIRVKIEEAEVAKLFSNAWRYIQFAATNQFYMICENFGIDYNAVRHALTEGYGRIANLPTAGFSAGPCLLKDTMQLVAFDPNFLLGDTAMRINEGLPNFVVEKLRKTRSLKGLKVGILGMTFKAEIDDIRDSLSFKLRKVLRFHGAEVLCSDEFAKQDDFVSKSVLLAKSEVVIIGVPHSAYKKLKFPPQIQLIDLWNIT